MNVTRSIVLRGAAGTVRTEQRDGRTWTVVPVVALMEGVVWPVNAPDREYVPLETLQRTPQMWNGRPVVLDHPDVDGQKVSANTPEILEARAFGMLFNTAVVDGKLTTEAWLDPSKAAVVGPEAVALVDIAAAGGAVEVSVGALVALEATAGEFNGTTYSSIWRWMESDHLAFLTVGKVGACSVTMGCGTNRAASSHVHLVTADGLKELPMPVLTTQPRSLKERLLRLMPRMAAGQLSPDMSDVDMRTELREGLLKLEPQLSWVEAVYYDRVVYSIWEDSEYCLYHRTYDLPDGGDATFGDRVEVELVMTYEPVDGTGEPVLVLASARLAELKAAAGKTISAENMKVVQTIHDATTNLGAACADLKAAAAKPCGCGGSVPAVTPTTLEGAAMTKEARIAALMAHKHNPLKDEAALKASSEAGLAALEAHCVTADAAEKKAGEDEVVRAAAAAKPQTEEEYLQKAPASIRTLVDRHKAADALRKTELVTALKACQTEYTEAELTALATDDLERIARLTKADVDFSGIGITRAAAAAAGDVFANPPNGYDLALKAAAGTTTVQ